MLFFKFLLQFDYDTIHNRINEIMYNDISSEGFWGQKDREYGICFKRNDKVVHGYFLEDSDKNSGIRSYLPLRTFFYGRFVRKNDTQYFQGVILPYPLEFISVIAVIFVMFFFVGWYALLPSALFALFFGIGYAKLIRETKNVLEVIFK